MKQVLNWIWQLPQNLLACIILLIHSKEVTYLNEFPGMPVWVIPSWDSWSAGVSLGNYILLAPKHVCCKTVKHEHGHQIQSQRLGWLYLFTVGIVSGTRNLIDRIFHKNWSAAKRIQWYYGAWPENEADILGGVKR